jgi:membrane protein required for colicin V production
MIDAVLSMTWIDWLAFTIMLVSVMFGVIRGIVREINALFSWFAAFWLAKEFTLPVSAYVETRVPNETVRLIVVFVALLLAGLMIMSIVGHLLGLLVRKSGMGPIDHTLGGLFGMARGALILIILTLLAGLTPIPAQQEWKTAYVRPWIVMGADRAMPYLPQKLSQKIHI